jgi:peptide/nickel transport system permease protein
MGRFILRRIIQGLIVIFGVTLIVFVVTRMVGDPVKVMLPLESTVEQRAAFERQLGLDRPIHVQFVDFVGDIVTLDFGDSLWQHRPAMEIVFEKLPLTLLLTAVGIGLAFVIAIPLGIIAALRPGGLVDRATVFVSLLGLSVPQFWLGLLFIMLFAVKLRILPTSGTGSAKHIILPALTWPCPPWRVW